MMNKTRRVLILVLLAICYQQSHSYRLNVHRRNALFSHTSLRALEANDADRSSTQTVSAENSFRENEAEMDRLLIENDDDDGDGDNEPITEAEIESELKEMDINLISESDIDRSIQNAVQKLVDSGPKEAELSRVETFENIYKNIKAKTGDPAVKMDHTSMLAALFADTQRKDPFDEKKVMMKFRTMLKNEDFENLFRDPLIGDFL